MFAYTAPKNLLAGKTILITGAGAGIGRAAALSYAEHGAVVILTGRTEEKLEQVYDEIEQLGYPLPILFPIDMATATYDDYKALATAITEEFGHLDGLLHNAGILGDKRPIEHFKPEDWNEVMQVNVNAQFMLTKALLPALDSADTASIIFTSSSVGRKGRAFWGAYAVSKFATEGLMQVLADELSDTSDIRVNSLNPGATNTAMRRRAYPAEESNNNPEPQAIMPAYLYLMGKDSAGVNGQALNAQEGKPT
jgi:NAD(P)-dependent dehydrogenase (short-subunit alcohol dehydrogenase family)